VMRGEGRKNAAEVMCAPRPLSFPEGFRVGSHGSLPGSCQTEGKGCACSQSGYTKAIAKRRYKLNFVHLLIFEQLVYVSEKR